MLNGKTLGKWFTQLIRYYAAHEGRGVKAEYNHQRQCDPVYSWGQREIPNHIKGAPNFRDRLLVALGGDSG